MRAVKKLKLVHVKLIRGLHHEGIAAADQLSADARDVSKLPRGALARAEPTFENSSNFPITGELHAPIAPLSLCC